MSTRTPIQVPEELKTKVDDLKEKFSAKTHYEVIEKLIQSYHAFNNYKEDQQLKYEQEKDRQRREMVDLGEETKERFIAFKNENKLQKDSSAAELLLHHFKVSANLDKTTFAIYQSLK